ncbi:hypothetical protein ACLEC1_17205, partial [Lonsdalea quercina]|uniref:hypothetical protein n=1 Tax=Lonsdalea quercina TaxID=71657 RepID=UPI00397630F2
VSPCESRELPGIKSVETLSASWGFLRWGEKEKSDHPAVRPSRQPADCLGKPAVTLACPGPSQQPSR